MKYIDADRLKAEIKKKRNEIVAEALDPDASIERVASAKYKKDALSDAISLIVSLQQEQPKVDLEKEVSKWWDAFFPEPDFKFRKHRGHIVSNDVIIKLAKHFYELGLKARTEE